MTEIPHAGRPQVTVLINSYNTADYLDQAIASARQQSRRVDQIVISDVSTDASAEVIARHSKQDARILAVYGKNRGQLATIVAGLAAAEGDLVFLLDGDDCYQRQHVETRLERWEKFPQADVLYGRHRAVGQSELLALLRGKQDHENAHWMGPIPLEDVYDWGNSTALAWSMPSYHAGGLTSCLSFRRSHLQRLPLAELCDAFGDELKANADYMMLLASALYGGRKVYVPDRTVDYRVHAKSQTGKYAMGEVESDYRQRYCCALARNWLCAAPRFGPALHDILDKELATVPNPSRGHRRWYAEAKKSGR